LKLISDEERDVFFASFGREAVHLEMRDVYAVKDEKERLARFLKTGYRDHDAEAEDRQPWITLIQEAAEAGKTFRRARIISEPVTDYIRFVWAGAGHSVEARRTDQVVASQIGIVYPAARQRLLALR
jgi:hypothetical protein